MKRVKHLLNSHALYSLYTTLIIPCILLTIVVNSGAIMKKADFKRYTCCRKKLYEYVNMMVTYHTQGPFFPILTLCVFMIWLNIVAWCLCLRYTIINFLAICCVSLREYMWPNVPKWVPSLNKWLCILLEFWIEHIKTKKVIYYMVQYSKYSQRYDTLNKKIAKTQFGEKQL